jgi:hypothetical protein
MKPRTFIKTTAAAAAAASAMTLDAKICAGAGDVSACSA